jgi:hypothetical protein
VSEILVPIYPCHTFGCERPAIGKLMSVLNRFLGWHCAECAAKTIKHDKEWGDYYRANGWATTDNWAEYFVADPAITPERITGLVASLRAEKARPDLWLAAGLIEQAYLRGAPPPPTVSDANTRLWATTSKAL